MGVSNLREKIVDVGDVDIPILSNQRFEFDAVFYKSEQIAILGRENNLILDRINCDLLFCVE
jgi:hypothetical protein